MRTFFALVPLAILLATGVLASEAQLSPELRQSIDRLVEEHRETANVPGVAVAVLVEGQPVHVGTHGVASLEHGNPITRSSVFELASLTKHMTALAVLELVGMGELSLDDTLPEILDRVPAAWDQITIGQLLSHTAGLAHRFEEKPHGSFLLDYSTEQMLASAKATPVLSTPGTDWSYSDQGYFLAGYVVEQVTGEAFGARLRDRYFEPSGMVASHRLEQRPIVPGRVDGYTLEDGVLVNARRVWQFGLMSHFGVVSTIDDMVRWEMALWRSQSHSSDTSWTLPSSAVAETWKVARDFGAVGSCETMGYARGWYVRRVGGVTYLDHGGFTGNHYVRSPDTGLAVIVLSNRDHAAGEPPSRLAWAIAAAVDPTARGVGTC